MADVVIDTDVASVLLKRRAPKWVAQQLIRQQVWLTFIAVGELSKWAEARSWGPAPQRDLAAWLTAQPLIPFDVDIARLWGRLAARAQLRGRARPQNDMWVAACCIHHDIPLLTLNQRDFADFAEHEGLRLLREPR